MPLTLNHKQQSNTMVQSATGGKSSCTAFTHQHNSTTKKPGIEEEVVTTETNDVQKKCCQDDSNRCEHKKLLDGVLDVKSKCLYNSSNNTHTNKVQYFTM